MKPWLTRLLTCALLWLGLAACASDLAPIPTLMPTVLSASPTPVPPSPTAAAAGAITPTPLLGPMSAAPTLSTPTPAPTDTPADSATPAPTSASANTPTPLLRWPTPTISPTITPVPPPSRTPVPTLAHLAPGLNTPVPAPTYGALSKILAYPIGLLGPATNVSWSADGSRLLTSGFNSGTCIYDTSNFHRTVYIGQDGLATLNGDGSQIVLVSDTEVRYFDPQSGAPLSTTELPTELKSATVLALSPDGRFAIFATPNYQLALWDQAAAQITQRWPTQGLSATFSADGQRLAMLLANGVVRVWALAENTLVKDIAVSAVDRVALSADGSRLLAGIGLPYSGPTVWDVSSGQPLRSYNILKGARDGAMMLAGAFSADGGRLMAALTGYDLFGVVDVASGQILFNPSALKTPVSLAFSPDGRRVAAAEGDAAFVWDLP